MTVWVGPRHWASTSNRGLLGSSGLSVTWPRSMTKVFSCELETTAGFELNITRRIEFVLRRSDGLPETGKLKSLRVTRVLRPKFSRIR